MSDSDTKIFSREHTLNVRLCNDIAKVASYSNAKVALSFIQAVLRIVLFPISCVLMLVMVILRAVLLLCCWLARGFVKACAYLEDVFGFWQVMFGLGYNLANNPFSHIYGTFLDVRFFALSRKRRTEHLLLILKRENVPQDMWPTSLTNSEK